MASWEDVSARVAGLRLHLLSPEQLRTLARSVDLPAVALGLEQAGFPVRATVVGTDAVVLDLAVRRRAGLALMTVARWSGPRVTKLAVVFEDEDRRSLRILFRGQVQGAAPAARLSGLIPTPALPERALAELAAQPTGEAMATLLAVWGNPYGRPLLSETRLAQPDLFRLELLLDRTWAERVRASAVGGDPVMRRFARASIDLANTRAALMLALQGQDVDPATCFLSGGELVDARAFRQAATAETPEAARERLLRALRGSLYAVVLREAAGDLSRLEESLLAALSVDMARLARREPNTIAPVLAYLLRLRAQVIDLRRLVWGVALDIPRPTLAADLLEA